MKRSNSNSTAEAEAPRRRRQPQISCSFCRSKKLKCDRAQPCSNCTSRGVPCDGETLSPRSPGLGTGGASPDVLKRLRRLEEAVFGSASGVAVENAVPAQGFASRTEETPTPQPSSVQREQSAELGYNHGLDAPMSDDCPTFTFRIIGNGEYVKPRQTSVRCIDLPSLDDTMAIYRDFFEYTRSHIVNTLHCLTVHTMIQNLYARVRQGLRIDLGSAALILSICATSAFSYDRNFPTTFSFPTEDNAAAQSRIWREAAFDLLDQSSQVSTKSIDAVQARLVLADLIYNIEGTSSRYRYLHSGARAAAYELGLHVVDLPGRESGDSEFEKEVKRRVWWYLAATDWLLCNSGGPMDRTYTVNSRHMRVNYPTHIPESDQLIPMFGTWSQVALGHTIMRIRLGEACRDIADALPLGCGGVETLPYLKVAALDRLFERILADVPSISSNSDILDSADNTVGRIALQQSLGRLALHARRARLLRPLLQADNLPRQFDVLRRRCLDSTEVVIDIASAVLRGADDTPGLTGSGKANNTRRGAYRGGLAINHLFVACAVLATDPALRAGGAKGVPGVDAGTERRRAALANACRLLEKAGEKSVMAADMVRRLVSVLRRHRVHGVEAGCHEPLGSGTTAVPSQQSVQRTQLPAPEEKQMVAGPSSFVASQQQHAPPNWIDGFLDPDGLGGIWNDFIGTSPTGDGWQQLFADLDSFAGGSVY